MTHSPPPGASRARIPGPRQYPPPHRRIRIGLRRRYLWGGTVALWVPTALVTYATTNTTLLPGLALLGSIPTCAAFARWAHKRHGRDPT